METGDLVTLAVGLLIVVVIALAVNPNALAGLRSPPAAATPAATPVPSPLPATPSPTTVPAPSATPTASPTPSGTPVPLPPVRILYTDKPFSYPVVLLPENIELFGEEDIRRSGQDLVTFAYLSDSRGGLSRTFTIPYPVWDLDVSVVDNTTPNIGMFRMALCYAANGTIIDGVEIEHPGTAFRKIQTSNTPMYLIISTDSIDSYTVNLQAERQYYNEYGPLKPVT